MAAGTMEGDAMSGGVGQLVLNGPLILAVPVAAAAGAITFISPCCLPLVPGYLAYVAGMSGLGTGGAGASALSLPGPGDAAGRPQASGRVTATLAEAAGPAARAGPRGRAGAGAALFVLGVSALFARYGAAFAGLGEGLLAHQRGLVQGLGGLTIVLGLLFAG